MWGVKINKYVYHLNVQYILRKILKYISLYSRLLWITKKTACCLLNANVACFPSAFEGHTMFGEVVSWGVTAQISHSWEEFKCSFAGSFIPLQTKLNHKKKEILPQPIIWSPSSMHARLLLLLCTTFVTIIGIVLVSHPSATFPENRSSELKLVTCSSQSGLSLMWRTWMKAAQLHEV